MQLRQLQYFEALYRLRSFVHAAAEHAVTQSALSRSLKNLETDLGQRLFDRTTHAVEPTDAAEGLIQRARDVIDSMLAFEEEAKQLRGGATGHVRVGTGPYPAQPLLTGAIPDHRKKETMLNVIREKNLIQCTLSYKFSLFLALKESGLADHYLTLLDPWKNMLKAGLSTFAEWDVEMEPRSDCHLWSSSPCYDFLATICGIMPAEPGFRSVLVKPAFGPLESIKGKMPHPEGDISVELRKRDTGGLIGSIILPDNVNGILSWKDSEIPVKGGINKIEL